VETFPFILTLFVAVWLTFTVLFLINVTLHSHYSHVQYYNVSHLCLVFVITVTQSHCSPIFIITVTVIKNKTVN
jgi:hypothetical protein